MSSVAQKTRAAHIASWAGPVVLLAALSGLFTWTHGKWFDPIIDFGRELYVPWRLTEGDVLYRDIAWFNGPLSAYFNAALFRLFGTSIATLTWANFVILGLLTGLVFSLVRGLADRVTATVAGLVFLVLFGFAHFSFMGNFNYIAPYSHEATHGITLGLAAFAATRKWRPGESDSALVLAGVLLGLTFLTKAEIFLAAVTGCATEAALRAHGERLGWTKVLASGAKFLASFLGVAFVGFVLLLGPLGARNALLGVLGTWRWIWSSDVEQIAFYRKVMGLLDPSASLLETFLGVGRWALVVGVALVVALRVRGTSRLPVIIAVAAAPASVALLVRRVDLAVWATVLRPLPLVVVVIGCLAAVEVVRSGGANPKARSLVALSAFSIVLLGKIVLAVNLAGYAFVLAMPAALLATVALVHVLPRWVSRRGGSAGVFRTLTLAVVAAVLLGNSVHAAGWLARKTVPVGRGADRFLSDRRGHAIDHALDEIEAIRREGETLVVVPEGVMINYMARIRNPSRHINFMPPELVLFGERAIVANLEASRPNYVMVTHRPTPDYGFERFGDDFSPELWEWVEANYQVEYVYGGVPRDPATDFGIELRSRRARDERSTSSASRSGSSEGAPGEVDPGR